MLSKDKQIALEQAGLGKIRSDGKYFRRANIHIPYTELKYLIENIPDAYDRCFIAIVYANGARIAEAAMITVKDIDWDDDFVYITQPVMKKRKKPMPKRNPPIDRVREKWLADIILDFVQPIKEKYLIALLKAREKKIPEPIALRLWVLSIRSASRRVDTYLGCTTHSLRHSRATHCFTFMRMGIRMVSEYFRISPSSLSDWVMRYGHLDTQDLADHLLRLRESYGNRKQGLMFEELMNKLDEAIGLNETVEKVEGDKE